MIREWFPLASPSQSVIFQTANQNHFSAGAFGNRSPWCYPRTLPSAPFVLFWHGLGPTATSLLPHSLVSFFPQGQSQQKWPNLSWLLFKSRTQKPLPRTGKRQTRDRGTGLYCSLGIASVWVPGVYGICIHVTKANFFPFFSLLSLLGFALSELICNQGTRYELSSASCLSDSFSGICIQRSYIQHLKSTIF